MNKHLMTGPKGNSEFCFLEMGNNTHCHKVFCYTFQLHCSVKEHDLITCTSKIQVVSLGLKSFDPRHVFFQSKNAFEWGGITASHNLSCFHCLKPRMQKITSISHKSNLLRTRVAKFSQNLQISFVNLSIIIISLELPVFLYFPRFHSCKHKIQCLRYL